MKSDPLPFCVCIKPTRAFVDGLPVANFCGSCGKPIPPQGEKCCPLCVESMVNHSIEAMEDYCGNENCPCHKESSVSYEEIDAALKEEESSVKEELPEKDYSAGRADGLASPKETPGSVKEEHTDFCFGQPCRHDGTQKCAVLPKETPVEGWEADFDDRFVAADPTNGWIGRMGLSVGEDIKDWIRLHLAEERQRGQMNPKVGFLRQYLNESPDWKGTSWDDEALLTFLRIPFAKSPREGAEGP